MKKRFSGFLFLIVITCPALIVYGREILLEPVSSERSGISLENEQTALLSENRDRGTLTWKITPENGERIRSVKISSHAESPENLNPAGDILVQLSWWKNGKWSIWYPENILPGGSFRDADGSGLPDKTDIIAFNSETTLKSDLPSEVLPDMFSHHQISATPSLVSEVKETPYFVMEKPEEEGQVIVRMRSDRFPSSEFLTVSGWNGWDLGEAYTMGLMSRFHEIDRNGDRLNKIMFIGDDDFNEFGGMREFQWRAVSFQPRTKTRRLNLYVTRLISSAGTIGASRYQLRRDSLTNEEFHGKHITSIDFSNWRSWHTPEPRLIEQNPDGLTLLPRPISNLWILSPSFKIPAVARISFSVEMDASMPERYNDRDPSHKAWMSTYLEFLDESEKIIDVVKISVCRPRWGSVLASAGERPRNCRRARIRLVASHKTYLPEEEEKNMDGMMICRWRNLEIFECLYPQKYRSRLDENPLEPGEIPEAEKYRIRAVLISDAKTPSPRLHNVRVQWNKKD